MTPEKYKELSIKEFTQAAKIYDSGHAGIYEMCKDDYPPILEELEKETFSCFMKNILISTMSVLILRLK